MFEEMIGARTADALEPRRNRSGIQKAVDLAKRSDVVVLVMGELSMMSGELASQSSLELPGKQQQLLEAVVAIGKPVALVLVNGRPLNITWAASHIPAILEVWHPEPKAATRSADLLFGDACPRENCRSRGPGTPDRFRSTTLTI